MSDGWWAMRWESLSAFEERVWLLTIKPGRKRALFNLYNSEEGKKLAAWKQPELQSEYELLPTGEASFSLYLDGGNVAFTAKRMPNRPNSVQPRLWCGVYSRPITKTVSLPSVVLIKKTAHVKSNRSSMLSVSSEVHTCRREESGAFLLWKSTHRLFRASPSLPVCLCSLVFLSLTLHTVTYQHMDEHGRTQNRFKELIKCCTKLSGQLRPIGWKWRKNDQTRLHSRVYCWEWLIYFICCFDKQIGPVTWCNIKAINLHYGSLKQRPGHFVIMKKKKEKAPSSNFMAAEARSG